MDYLYPEEKMTKILTIPIDKDNLYNLNKLDIDGFVIGLKGYSIYTSLNLTLEDIKELNIDKELYISINKLLNTKEIDELKPIVEELSKLNIKGIMFDDIGIINICKNIDLIWSSMHHVTNSKTINFWTKQGIKGAVLSTEITLDDFISIKKNTNTNIFVYLYGYLPMFESSRELLTNYFKYISKPKTDDIYYLKNNDKYYPIYEENNNTYILEDILDGIEELDIIKKNNIDYVILNGLLHDNDTFINIVKKYINGVGKSNKKGFLYKETIYKVRE